MGPFQYLIIGDEQLPWKSGSLEEPTQADGQEECVEFFDSGKKSMQRLKQEAGNTKGESITVPLMSCLTDLESAVCQ